MPGINLTRDEAAERARLLDVSTYDIALDLTTSEATFASTTTLRFSCTEPGASSFADLHGATVESITLNGAALDATAYADNRIALDGLQADNALTVVATLPYSHTGEGLHRFVDPVDKLVYLYTQFEVPDARRVFTTFEQPDLKGTFTFHITAPSHWQIVSNAATPEPQEIGLGRSVWHFPTSKRISTYITALIAGEYVSVHDTYHGKRGDIELGIYLRESLRQYLDEDDLFTVTKQGFAFFEDAFDMPYPFEKYDQLFVPEYNMGAMENAGAVTLRDDMIYRSRQTRSAYEGRANTILHEMAHMWFGDLVTMRWWDDLWLNESFAEWAAYHACTHATKYDEAWTSFTNARKTWAYRQDQLPSTHPIAADNHDLEAVATNFDGITYAKGASALRQLVAWVGEDQFLAGLRDYFNEHAYGNSQLTDLLSALELSSGRELGSWAKEWLQTSGVNTVRPAFEVDGEGRFTSFTVVQTAHPAFPTLRRHRLGVGLYDLADGALVRRTGVEIDVAGDETEVAELVGERQPDLVLLNDGDLSYTKVRLDQRSLRTVLDNIDRFSDSLPRALCWGAAWDMTRDAEMRASDWVSLVLRGIGSETDTTALRALVMQTARVVSAYTAPEHRADVSARWDDGIRALALAAEPGSDQQLTFVRGLASAAVSDESLDLIQGLLDGSRTLEGLAVDVDLRWTLLQALTSSGRADEDEIRAELERDHTISGQENAAAARASRPTAEAKAEAWNDAVVRDDVPNETMRSIAFAFNQPRQEDVLKPYVAKYLETAETYWEERTVHQASTVVEFMFPRMIPTQETLDAVDAWLETATPSPAARRYVMEGRSDLERALNAQRKDAEA